MFISHAASAANGFKKWSAAHPAAKYVRKSNEAASIGLAVSDISSPHPESTTSSRRRSDVGRAMRLRKTAKGAPTGSPLRERLLDLALQYDRMAANSRHDSRQMSDE